MFPLEGSFGNNPPPTDILSVNSLSLVPVVAAIEEELKSGDNTGTGTGTSPIYCRLLDEADKELLDEACNELLDEAGSER